MGIKSLLSKPLARWVVEKQNRWSSEPEKTQETVFKYLVENGKKTLFGKEHAFHEIRNMDDYRKHVPVYDYEDFSNYIEQIKKGAEDILWPGKPVYLAKTSGTTSGVKYIPITKASMPYHINAARDALLNYIYETGKSVFLDGNMIFLSGSPELQRKNGLYIGRLSGIVNHHVPSYLRTNQKPSYKTNCIEDWEEKLETVIDETLGADMTLISGIPPWVQMYFDRIIARTGKKIQQVFPHFSVFVYGGVNFDPYKAKLFESIGSPVDSIETYPASEGFIAFQNSQRDPGLLLLLNSGIFYEFIPVDEYFSENPSRHTIAEVKTGVNYAVVISTNAGLWSYSIGDTVKFISQNPWKIVVTGRIKHFISAFGEHVIAEEVEKALHKTLEKHPETQIVEFTVAPQVVASSEGLPHHEWLIEFENSPTNAEQFRLDLDQALVDLNIYYKDLITGNILEPLKITYLRKNAFINLMKDLGKLGGQNKVPRLANDRKFADRLEKFKV